MSLSSRARRIGYLILGFVLLALGLIGLVLPLMPTTIFLILAAACFGRSSPRLEAKMLAHPRFGTTLRQWREEGAIGRRGKMLASAGMALGLASFWFFARPGVWLGIGVTAFFVACAAYVLSRPAPRMQSKN